MKRTHDYIHYYSGYWSEGGKCRIRINQEGGCAPVVICSQLPDNDNTSITNMAEYIAAEVVREHKLPTPLAWVEHYPRARGRDRRVLASKVLQLGSGRGVPRGRVAVPGRVTSVVPPAPRGGEVPRGG